MIIISRNRPDFLMRLFKYYLDKKVSAPIYLADASEGNAKERVQSIIEGFQNKLNLHYKAYTPEISPFERLEKIYSEVETRYVIWIGDDDFTIPGAIDKGSDFLDKNPDYAGVLGLAKIMEIKNDGAFGHLQTMGDYLQKALPENDAYSRLTSQSQIGQALTYTLRRTAHMKRMIGLQKEVMQGWDYNRKNAYLFEVSDALFTAAFGKIHKLDELMMVRQVHKASANKTLDNESLYVPAIFEEGFKIHAQKLVSGINLIINGDDQIERSQFEQLRRIVSYVISKGIAKMASNEIARPISQKTSAATKLKKIFKEKAPGITQLLLERKNISLVNTTSQRELRKIFEIIRTKPASYS